MIQIYFIVLHACPISTISFDYLQYKYLYATSFGTEFVTNKYSHFSKAVLFSFFCPINCFLFTPMIIYPTQRLPKEKPVLSITIASTLYLQFGTTTKERKKKLLIYLFLFPWYIYVHAMLFSVKNMRTWPPK